MRVKYEGVLRVCSGELSRKGQDVMVVRRRRIWGMAGNEIESKCVDDQYDGSFVCCKRGAPIMITFVSVWKRQSTQEKSLCEQVYPYAVNKRKPK